LNLLEQVSDFRSFVGTGFFGLWAGGRDPHSRRVVFDTVECHDRLERLANMRRELGFLPTPGDRANIPGDRAE
jgi:hypothetical protein